jgi:Skp family chaperone for outer membrane proteins
MKRFSFIAFGLFAVAFLVQSASAQGATAQQGRIGWIDTAVFADEKEGITRFVNAFKALGNEAQPREKELIDLQNKIGAIAEDLRKMQNAAPNVPINQQEAIRKQDEGGRLQRELEFKKKDYDVFIERRGMELLGPINQDIGRAIQDFAKQKGYSVVLDVDKLAQAGLILHLDPTADITKEFIEFYNKRPAGAATATNPR